MKTKTSKKINKISAIISAFQSGTIDKTYIIRISIIKRYDVAFSVVNKKFKIDLIVAKLNNGNLTKLDQSNSNIMQEEKYAKYQPIQTTSSALAETVSLKKFKWKRGKTVDVEI